MEVQSSVGNGTCFTLRLPLIANQVNVQQQVISKL